MTQSHVFAALAAALALVAPAARAQAPISSPPASSTPPAAALPATDDPNQISELVVVAHPQGPAMWRVEGPNGSVMMILGSVTPLQQQQHWDQRQTLAALDGARLLLVPPKADMGPLQVMGLLAGNFWKARQGRALESFLPPDVRARFVSQRRDIAHQPENRYAHWKPGAAGFLLLSDVRRAYGFSQGKPGTKVAQYARERGVPVQNIGVYHIGLLFKYGARLNDQQNLECLKDALDQMEYEGARAQTLNDDWARGDVLAVNARYRLPPLQRCLMLAPGAQGEIDHEMAAAADRMWAELQKPGKTVAVIDMAWLLPRDGLLDRLKAKGATVGPPPALRDAAG